MNQRIANYIPRKSAGDGGEGGRSDWLEAFAVWPQLFATAGVRWGFRCSHYIGAFVVAIPVVGVARCFSLRHGDGILGYFAVYARLFRRWMAIC